MSTASNNSDNTQALSPDAHKSLDLETKARLCSGRNLWQLEPVEELGLGRIMVADGPHGLRKQADGGEGIVSHPATCFPPAVGLAASWDRALLAEVGAAIGAEALAADVAVVLGPGANIKRHPLCGRNFEYLSEDPLLSGELAVALIDGIQSVGVGTSLKHFAVNNQEALRMSVDAVVDERALREIYLAGFERAVKQAKPWTLMCAYNKLNGTYCSEHHRLLTEILRDEWGFEGLVMTDWGAASDRPAGIAAGLDLEMPGSRGINDGEILEAVANGSLTEDELDAAVERVLALIVRGSGAVTKPAPTVNFDDHHELARRAAADSCVLLTNDGILPLAPGSSIALIGAFADKPRYQGSGSSRVNPTQLDTLLGSITELNGGPSTVSYAAGYENDGDNPRPDLIDEARLVARSADLAVVVVGLPPSFESEGFDRDHMRMPDQHNRLVEAVCEANPNTVVVLCNGSPVQIPYVDRPRAILEAYLGGQGGGMGAARILFGEANPSGSLAETFPIRQTDHGSDPWFPGVGRQVQYREGIHVGYRWFDRVGLEVLFPFGHGLSYTTFDYGPLEVDGQSNADQGIALTARIAITNTGNRAGTETVQLYATRQDATVDRAAQELVGFQKIYLEPGQSESIEIPLDQRSFAFYDVKSAAWQIEPGLVELRAGSSSRDIRTTAQFNLVSSFQPGSGVTPAAPSVVTLQDDTGFEARLGYPIPEATPVEPFNRNSTVEEVSVTAIGRRFAAAVNKAAMQQFGLDEHTDDSFKLMFERMTAEAPLRSLAVLSGGKLSWATVDNMVKAMNASRRLSRKVNEHRRRRH